MRRGALAGRSSPVAVRPLATLAVVSSLAALGLGCGAKPSPRTAIDNVVEGLAQGDGKKACASLTAKAQVKLASRKPSEVSCPKVVEALGPDAFKDCRGLEVARVRTAKVSGTATLRGPHGERRIALQKFEGGSFPGWKLRSVPCGPPGSGARRL